MKKEIGKWLLEISKYLITTIFFTSVFGDIQNKAVVYAITFVSASISFSWGLLLIKNKKENKED